MKSISHQASHALLQIAADRSLTRDEQADLGAHLDGCVACRGYARNLRDLESGLSRVTRQQWDAREPALSLPEIKQRAQGAVFQNRIGGAISRFAVIPVLALAFVMAVRMVMPQQIAVNAAESGTPRLSFHTPTPPSQFTLTVPVTQVCANLSYVVQPGDNLDTIAAHFSIPREAIRQYNGLSSDQLPAGTRLGIPVCDQTPAGTSTTTPTVTITIIPQDAQLSPSPTG